MVRKSSLLAALCAAILSAATAEAQQPTTPPVQWMPGDLSTGTARGAQQTPAIAWGGVHYLMAWTDGRAIAPTEFGTESDDDIYAARIDANGALVDATSIPIATGYGFQRNPQIAWNGANWLVAWTSQTPTPSSYYDVRVWATRVSPGGTVLDRPFQVVPVGSSYTHFFTLTSNGSDWCIVSQGSDANGLIGARVSAQGTVLDPGGVELTPPYFQGYFDERIASAAGEYLLVFSTGSGSRARRFTSTLTQIGTEFAVPGAHVSSNGSSYYMVWANATSGDLVGSPMSVTGTLQIPNGALLRANGGGLNEIAQPSWDGTNWWAAWNFALAPVAARVAPTGTVLDPGGIVVDPTHSTYTYSVAIGGSAQGGAQVAWTDGRVEFWDVYGVHVNANAQAGPAAPLPRAAGAQFRPRLAAGPAGSWLAVGLSELGGQRRVLAWRLDAIGQALDPEPIEIASAPSVTVAAPSVAFDGARYMVVWPQGGTVFARRMLPDGTILDATPIAVLPGWSPDVAALNGVFLVVCARSPGNPQYVFAYSRRVDGATGALLGPESSLAIDSFVSRLNVVAFGSHWLAVAQRNFTHDDTQSQVQAVLVDSAGVSGPTIRVVEVGGGAPAAAVSPTKAMIAYRTGSSASADNDLAGRILNTDGSFATSSFNICTESGAGWAKQFAPTVAWDGTNFVVAWEDQRNQETFYDARTDIYGARVDEGGAVLDPTSFAVADALEPECFAALAGAGNGSVLFAASVMRTEAPYAAYRIGTRLLFDGCNAPVAYCIALPNSAGPGALMGSSGSPSISTNGFTLTVAGAVPGQHGIFFYGANQTQVPFGEGFRCIQSPAFRLYPPIPANGSGAVSRLLDFTAPPASSGPGQITAGSTWNFQFWYRDPAGGGSNFNLSDGYAVTFCP